MKWRTTSATHSVLHDSWLLQGTRVNESKSYGHKNIMAWDKINSSWIWHLLLDVINFTPPSSLISTPMASLVPFVTMKTTKPRESFQVTSSWIFLCPTTKCVVFSNRALLYGSGVGASKNNDNSHAVWGGAFGAPWSLFHRKASHIWHCDFRFIIHVFWERRCPSMQCTCVQTPSLR